MCGRYIQTSKTRLIKKKFNINNCTEEDFFSHNISPSKFSLIITNNKEISDNFIVSADYFYVP